MMSFAAALPPPPPPSDYIPDGENMLTRAEIKRWHNTLAFDFDRLDPANKTDCRIVAKLLRHSPQNPHLTPAIMAKFPDFLLSADTEFMLSGPKVALPIPEPSRDYNLYSNLPTVRLPLPKMTLVILDLNGTLLHRHQSASSTNFRRRDKLEPFLHYLFDPQNGFKVMIWTTAVPANANMMCDGILTASQKHQLVAKWDRNNFNLTRLQYSQKLQVYKRLEWVWNDGNMKQHHPYHMSGAQWDQTNTILIDDSMLKAKAQPHNHIFVPEFEGPKTDAGVKYGAVLEQVAGYLEEAKHQTNVSRFIKDTPFKVDEKVGGDSTLGGWFKNLSMTDELDPTGAIWPRNDQRNLFMRGYGDDMMQWG